MAKKRKDQLKIPTGFTLSPECRRLITLLSERFGISKTGIIEQVIREKARAEGIGQESSGGKS